MAVLGWDPFRELMNAQEQFERTFGSLLGGQRRTSWLPAVDVFDGKEEVVLKADLPGVASDAVNVEIDENVLTVRGERRPDMTPDAERFYRVERPTGSFERSIALPQGIVADKVDAAFEDGVLTIRVPKAEEAKPRRIEIQARSAGQRTIEGRLATDEKAQSAT